MKIKVSNSIYRHGNSGAAGLAAGLSRKECGTVGRAHAERAEEKHAGDAGAYIKSLVYGGLDGIITTFAIVCAAVGTGLSRKAVVVMGFANLVADAMSMGLGDTLSEMAERDFIRREWERETWEMDTNPSGKVQEMQKFYVQKGVSEEDASRILKIFSKYTVFFVEHMMQVELGLLAPDEPPWAKGAVQNRIGETRELVSACV